MMQHLERAAKRFCSEHARAYAKSSKTRLECQNACVHAWLRNTAVIAGKACSGIAHSAYRGILQQWPPHRSEPSDY